MTAPKIDATARANFRKAVNELAVPRINLASIANVLIDENERSAAAIEVAETMAKAMEAFIFDERFVVTCQGNTIAAERAIIQVRAALLAWRARFGADGESKSPAQSPASESADSASP